MQTMVMGYPGLRIDDTGLAATPACIQGATFLKLRSVHYQDSVFDLEYECDGTSPNPLNSKVTLVKEGQWQMRLQWFNEARFRMVPMLLGQPVEVEMMASTVSNRQSIRIVRV